LVVGPQRELITANPEFSRYPQFFSKIVYYVKIFSQLTRSPLLPPLRPHAEHNRGFPVLTDVTKPKRLIIFCQNYMKKNKRDF